MMVVAVVTGGNQGIGYASARRLLLRRRRDGAGGGGGPSDYFYRRVVLACRDVAAGRAAAARMMAERPGDGARAAVAVVHLDLASLSTVRSFPRRLRDALGRDAAAAGVGTLVCNAGKGWGTRTKDRVATADGYESFFQVNYLGHFLLTLLLLPDLVRGAQTSGGPSRIVHVSSSLHDPASRGNRNTNFALDLDALEQAPAAAAAAGVASASAAQPLLQSKSATAPFNPKGAYCRSKLMQIMFSYAMERRLRAHNLPVTSSCLNPGFIPASGLIRDSSCLGICFLRCCLDGVFKLCCAVTRSLDDGGTCVYLVATATHGAATEGGQYFEYTRDGVLRAHRSSEESYDTGRQERLWRASCRLCGLASDGGLASIS